MEPGTSSRWFHREKTNNVEASSSDVTDCSPTNSYDPHEQRKIPTFYRASARTLLLRPSLKFDQSDKDLPRFVEELVRKPKVCWNHVQGRCSEAEMCTRLHIVDEHCVLCGASGLLHPLQLTHHLIFCPEMIQLRHEYRRVAEEGCGICYSALPLNCLAPEENHLWTTTIPRQSDEVPDTNSCSSQRGRNPTSETISPPNCSHPPLMNSCRAQSGPLGLLADCGHTFCYSCIELWRVAMHSSVSAEGETVTCPVCRTLNSTIVPCSRFIGDRSRCSREKSRFLDRLSQVQPQVNHHHHMNHESGTRHRSRNR